MQADSDEVYKCSFSLRRIETASPNVELLACSKVHALACAARKGLRNRKAQKLFGWGSNANWAIGQVVPMVHGQPSRIETPEHET